MPGKKDMVGTLRERFLAKVRKEEDHWWWEGAIDADRGYGVLFDEGDNRKAHIISYELYIGPIPEGLEVLHLCQNKLCVRPECLKADTHATNMAMERKPFCKNGHPQPETGRTKSGNCKACQKDYLASYRK